MAHIRIMRKQQLILILFTIAFGVNNAFGQSDQEIQWMTWDEAMAKMEVKPQKVLIDVYTTWCNWCKRMDTTTLDHPQIADYINENFYAVKLDAEQRKELTYKGLSYRFVKSGNRGYHELAAKLLRGRLSYPSMVFLDENQDLIQSIVGFKTVRQFEVIATYFGNNKYKQTPWSSYQRSYQPQLTTAGNEK